MDKGLELVSEEKYSTYYFDNLLNENVSVDYDDKKWLYIPKRLASFRYILGTRGKRTLLVIGLNPSTAVPDNLDNTLKSVQRIALANNYDSFIMFNLYPQRATIPNNMHKEINDLINKENIKAFEWVISSFDVLDIWAAWGAIINTREYLKDIVQDFMATASKKNLRWLMADNILKSGHPHHPLYLKKDAKLIDFNINEYILKLRS